MFPLSGSRTLHELEAEILARALEKTRYNVTAAARLLGVTRQTLRYRIEKHNIQIKP